MNNTDSILEYKNTDLYNRPELLAPAGNPECLEAAVTMGADAVYLSGKEFGARSYADNFDRDQLREAVKFSHLRGVKVHVTVNTVVGDKELGELEEYLLYLDEIGADALIIQDLGVLRIAKKLGIRPQLHASTQLTVHSLAGAKSAVRLGFDRIVLSRELSFEQIKYISENCGAETEIFIHGAMCMSYSGQCLMSSMLGGRSGNRGKCAQPCRQAYKYNSKSERFCLSLKDMSLANRIDKVLESGVSSLKIEGRMKGSAYVGCVVKTYADCLRENRKPTKRETERMNRIFYRGGQSSGYFDNKIGTDMFTFDKPDNPYKSGSKSIADEIAAEIAKWRDRYKIRLNCDIEIVPGSKIKMNLSGEGISACVLGDNIIETASSKPVTGETVLRQIKKTGGSIFEFDNININIKDNPFVPLKEINEIRRRAIETAENIILENMRPSKRKISERKQAVQRNKNTDMFSKTNEFGFTASVLDIAQYKAVIEFENENNVKFLYISVPQHIIQSCIDEFSDNRERIAIEPPAIVTDREFGEYSEGLRMLKSHGFGKLRVHNISGFENEFGFELFGSWRLNVTNSLAVRECFENGICTVMLSPELSLPQIRDISKNSCVPTEVLGYGYVPLMITENCIIKNLDEKICPCGKDVKYMTDRIGKKFPIIRDGSSCRSVLLNSCPTFMADKQDDIIKAGADLVNLRFSVEPSAAVKQVCGAYFGVDDYVINDFTRMHFYKGII